MIHIDITLLDESLCDKLISKIVSRITIRYYSQNIII